MASGHKSQLFRLHPTYFLEQGGAGSMINSETRVRTAYVQRDVPGDLDDDIDDYDDWVDRDGGRGQRKRKRRRFDRRGVGRGGERLASDTSQFPCRFLPVSLSPDREVQEHQMVALYPDTTAQMKVLPDAAGCSFGNASERDEWMSKVKWAINQTQQPIRRDMLFELSCRPGLDDEIINTGADPIRDGDRLFVRIPTSRDLQAQRDRLPYSERLSLADAAKGAPLWATYGVAEESIDPTARFQAQLDAYKRRYALGRPTDVASNLQAERIERTTICLLASLAVAYHKQLERDRDFREGVRELLPHYEDSLPVVTDKVLPVLRNSPLFLTGGGVAFQTSVLEHVHRLATNTKAPYPVAVVTQAHEQGKHDLTEIKTGELLRAVLT